MKQFDVLVKGRLVVLRDEHVIRLLLLHHEAGKVGLRVHRIGGNDLPFEIKVTQQRLGVRDLIGLLPYALLGHDDGLAVGDRR